MISITNETTHKSAILDVDTLISIKGGTWDHYWRLSSEDLKVEFIGDVIYIHSPASLGHEEIFGHLYFEMKQYIKSNEIQGKLVGSRFPLELVDGKRVEPDLFFISEKNIEEGKLTNTLFTGSPDLVIEIISPNYRSHDTVDKLAAYTKLNIKEYWIIDPELKELHCILVNNSQITMKTIHKTGKISPKVFPDLEIDVDILWNFGLEK